MSERVFERLEQIYGIGGGEGANRPGFSAAEDEAVELAAGWMEDAGFEVERDATGNVVGRLRGMDPALPEVWSGSHLDSVPRGGKFDGPLGVVGALEAVERIGPQRRTLGVVVFRAEETGCQGSKAYDGPLPGAFLELHIEQGRRLLDAGRPLGRRQRDRRLLPADGDLRRRRRPRGHDADGRPRRRARQGGRIRLTRA